jgi:DNA-binding winged helix-turn-helix (wHTH) protein
MRVSFGDFVLDRSTRQLLCRGEERHLEPKAFEVLDLLLNRRPEAVSKSEIQQRLWPDAFVSESSLTGLVAQIRQALGDTRSQPRFIRTVHGFGYAFSGEASAELPTETGKGGPTPWVVWEEQVIPLRPGENLLGRDEDLASKNGTFLGERRLDAAAALRDGDTFQLGRQLLVFRSSRTMSSTLTESVDPRRSD